MQKYIKSVVILPEGYTTSGQQYPVIYLLHGLSDNYAKWITEVPKIKMLVDQYQVLVVCPDGGYGSWYLDSPVNRSSQYETFITSELINYIEKHYHAVAAKSGRAITGLSMGGHGAVYIAAKHPELFAAAGSMSGVLDLLVSQQDSPTMQWLNKEIAKVLGSFDSNSSLWQAHSVNNLIPVLKSANLPLLLDIGVDDFLIESNRVFHQQLIFNKVPHAYLERTGKHDWNYWREAIGNQFFFLNQYLRHP